MKKEDIMKIVPVTRFNHQTQLRTKHSNLKNRYQEESTQTDTILANEVNFKGRCSKLFAVLGGALGACFGPVAMGVGATLGHKYGKMIDDDAEEVEKRDDYNGNEDMDPNNMWGKF